MYEEVQRKRLHRYDTPGDAHALNFLCHDRRPYLQDRAACECFLNELEKARSIYNFALWAYVLMSTHVHLLLWPRERKYSMARISSGIKGIMSKRYRALLLGSGDPRHDRFLVGAGPKAQFTFWQPGGGYDRNLRDAKGVAAMLHYIERNPVKAGLVNSPEEWPWSSAHARAHGKGVVPDPVMAW